MERQAVRRSDAKSCYKCFLLYQAAVRGSPAVKKNKKKRDQNNGHTLELTKKLQSKKRAPSLHQAARRARAEESKIRECTAAGAAGGPWEMSGLFLSSILLDSRRGERSAGEDRQIALAAHAPYQCNYSVKGHLGSQSPAY